MTGEQPGERLDVLVPTAVWRHGPAGSAPGHHQYHGQYHGRPHDAGGLSRPAERGADELAGRRPPHAAAAAAAPAGGLGR